MAIRFLHSGDWHIGKPFGRFADEKAALLRDARARIPDRLAGLARQHGASAVLVAGDIFDTALVADETLRRLLVRFGQYRDVTWHLLPGNHDPATPNGIWHRFITSGLPENVRVHTAPGAIGIAPGIELLASPLRTRHLAHDPTAWMDEHRSPPDTIRIGLAHGAVQHFGSADEAGVLIDPRRADRASLDYLALGDWHGLKEVGPRAWYAGTPEPDQFPANEPGNVLLVEIERAGAPPRVTACPTARYIWTRHRIEADFRRALGSLEAELSALGAGASDRLLAVALVGRVNLEDEATIRDGLERIGDFAFHLESDLSGLRIDDGKAAGRLFGDAITRAVAERLGAQAAVDGEDGKRAAAVAHRALRLLHDIAGRPGSGGAA